MAKKQLSNEIIQLANIILNRFEFDINSQLNEIPGLKESTDNGDTNLGESLDRLRLCLNTIVKSGELLDSSVTYDYKKSIVNSLYNFQQYFSSGSLKSYVQVIPQEADSLYNSLVTCRFFDLIVNRKSVTNKSNHELKNLITLLDKKSLKIESTLADIEKWNIEKAKSLENTYKDVAKHFGELADENIFSKMTLPLKRHWLVGWFTFAFGLILRYRGGYSIWLFLSFVTGGIILWLGWVLQTDLSQGNLDNISFGYVLARTAVLLAPIYFLVFFLKEFNYAKRLRTSYLHKKSSLNTMSSLLGIYSSDVEMQRLISEKALQTIFSEPKIKESNLNDSFLSQISKIK